MSCTTSSAWSGSRSKSRARAVHSIGMGFEDGCQDSRISGFQIVNQINFVVIVYFSLDVMSGFWLQNDLFNSFSGRNCFVAKCAMN